MKHSQTITCLFTFLALLISHEANAGALQIVSGNWDVTNNSDREADDFHMVVELPLDSSYRLRQEDFYDDGIFQDRRVTLTIWNPQLATANLKWSDAKRDIEKGEEIHVGFEYRASKNGAKIKDAYWTLKGDKNPGKQPQIPGFRATEQSALTYTAFNDTLVELTIENLQFLITPTRTDLQDLIPYRLPGFGSSEALFTLAPGHSLDFFPGNIGPSEFLLAQFVAYPTNDPTNVMRGMWQHQSVPAPSSVILSFIGLFALLLLSRKPGGNYSGTPSAGIGGLPWKVRVKRGQAQLI